MKKLIKCFLLFCMVVLCSCGGSSDKIILNEEFNGNEIGWPEESTSSHEIKISDGSYSVHSITKDSTKLQTSVSPQRVWFLLNAPPNYEIATHMKRMDNPPDGEYGVLLLSSTLTYRFALTDSGKAYVTEYDYNTELDDTLLVGSYYPSREISSSGVLFRLLANDRNLRLFLNDKFIGSINVKTSQWEDLRLFTSARSKIVVDYLRINRTEEE